MAYNQAVFSACPNCGAKFLALAFPAIFSSVKTSPARGTAAAEGEAGCFFHPEKKAVIHCASCGRFLCSLCDIELGSSHLCPDCVTSQKESGKREDLITRRVLHDRVAFTLSVYPILFVWPTIVTAPAALYYTVRHWKSPLSILPRTRIRFVFAFFMALLQVAAWTTLIVSAL